MMAHKSFENDMNKYNRLSPLEKALANQEVEKAYNHRDLVKAVVRSMHKSSLEDDVLQGILAKASALKFLIASGDEKHYCRLLCEAARHIVLDELRKKANKATIPVENLEAYDRFSNRYDNPLIQALQQETFQEIDHALDKLAKERETYALYVNVFRQNIMEGIPAEIVAQREGIERNYVYTAIKRVREMLPSRIYQ